MAAKKTVKANTEAPVEEKVVTEPVEEVKEVIEEPAPAETEETPAQEPETEETTQEPEEKSVEESAILEVGELSKEFNEVKDELKDLDITKPEDVTDEQIETLKQNVEKVTELKNKVEKIVKKLSNQEFTSYWNGQSYDF